MNQDQFNELTEKLLTACKDALGMKAGEYAREGDRLHNFYAAARKLNKHPLDSLLGMQVKHRVSIDDICDDIVKHKKFPSDEMMLEKFKDDINYNLLAFALIHELREKARKEVFAASCPLPEGAVVHKEFFIRPAGTISSERALSWTNCVKYNGDRYLPVSEEEESQCDGCFFYRPDDIECNNECKCFRMIADECGHGLCGEEGIIWKKIA